MSRPLEIAALQTIGRDGAFRSCPRPDEVRRLVERLAEFRLKGERCQMCRRDATGIRSSVAVCDACRSRITPVTVALHDDTRHVVTRASDAPAGSLAGYAIVFDRLSEDLGGFKERIRPSAVNQLFEGTPDIRALWNHDSNYVIGRTGPGTLGLQKTTRGVAVQIDPPQSAAGYMETIERGDVSGMSFAFRALDDEWYVDGDMIIRDVLAMIVSEVSPVAFPAYPDTEIHVVPNSREWKPSLKFRERQLRAKGIA